MLCEMFVSRGAKMKDIECINCKRKYKLKISDDSFRVNKVFIFDEKADKYNNKTWNIFRCSCGVVIEDNYIETNTSHNSNYLPRALPSTLPDGNVR